MFGKTLSFCSSGNNTSPGMLHCGANSTVHPLLLDPVNVTVVQTVPCNND